MSPAGNAVWLSLFSFGPFLVLLGLTVAWLGRRGITPPAFLGWAMVVLTVVDAVILLITPWPIILVASVLLVLGVRRASVSGSAAV